MPTSIRLLALVASASFALAGCSAAPSAGLRLTPANPAAPALTAAFPAGVADVQDSGDTNLVFACVTGPAAPGGPAVRQVLNVRVMWRQGYNVKEQMRGVHQNAALHWYVSPVADSADAAGGSAGLGVVEYTGTGLVDVDRDGDRLTVTIRSADVTPVAALGGMTDPVGPATLTGTLVARRDAGVTSVALGELRASVAAAKLPASPARTTEASLPLGQ